MKKLILSVSVIAAIVFTSCKNEAKKDNEPTAKTEQIKDVAMANISFGVRGNCEMCKSTIEKAANSVEGVSKAVWDVDAKKIDVSFDDTKTNEMAIHNAIAGSGYDTEKMSANPEAYSELPSCCQYDHEMAMNQTK
ncbi:heavy-metal-associated domain-containing protein [Gaetbulibacter sp. M235]|uniref:heavy-metal-associated domain-containing protein n=1 Tax=Gaetbulibacter sp. M235 TaxID=3126510 RepID=UPI00374E86B1